MPCRLLRGLQAGVGGWGGVRGAAAERAGGACSATRDAGRAARVRRTRRHPVLGAVGPDPTSGRVRRRRVRAVAQTAPPRWLRRSDSEGPARVTFPARRGAEDAVRGAVLGMKRAGSLWAAHVRGL